LVPLKVNADGELVVNLEAATVNIGDVDVLSSALPTGAATEQGLDDILAKLSADPATQTTLAAILAKLIAAPATEANQALIKAAVEAVTAKLSSDPATQTTLALIKTAVEGAIPAGTNAIGKTITPTFSVSDSFTRPANSTPYAANKSMNCSVAVTALAYTLKVVTLTAANAFAVGDRITVAGCNTGFTVTNVDGNWICKTGTNATTVVFDVTSQPVGTTPQTITVGTIAKCLSLDIAGVLGGGIILSRISVALPGVAMTGAVRLWCYEVQPTVLVDQATFTLLSANDTYRKFYIDLYPVTSGSGSDMCFAEWIGWMEVKANAADTRLYFRLEAMGAGTPTSAGVASLRASGIQLLG
jgi:hypothetical protein